MDIYSLDNSWQFILRLETRYNESFDKRKRPNDRSYNTVINAWVKSSSPSSTERAEKVLYRMIEAAKAGNKDAQPNIISFSSIMVCVHYIKNCS